MVGTCNPAPEDETRAHAPAARRGAPDPRRWGAVEVLGAGLIAVLSLLLGVMIQAIVDNGKEIAEGRDLLARLRTDLAVAVDRIDRVCK